jgi:peptidoglycan hydrolase-like protein with peptidoglycan-binding domain
LALQSRLFVGDAALEAAAASDAAHIVQGSSGPHVRKIQTALSLLDDAKLNADGSYGRLTAAAVLNYKRARAIINTARQTEADDIVGQMTIAALDAELVVAEGPKGPIRIKPVFTAAGGHSQSQLQARALVAFGLNDFPALPGSPALSSPAFELTPAGLTRFTVTGGANCTVDTQDHGIALVIDPDIPNAHGGKLSVTTDPQEFVLQAGAGLGNTLIVVQRKGKQSFPFGFDSAFANVLVSRALPKRDVTIAFNFVDGQNLVQTKRSDDSSLDAVINSLNAIYEPQAHIIFRRAPGSRFRVAGLASQDPKVGVVFAKGRRTDDWNKITSHRTGALLNVFFVGAMSLDDTQFSNSAVALSQVFGTANFVRRDICIQDDLRGNAFEITVAHECGHSFGALDNTTDGSLMRTPGPGKTISDQDAVSMNNSLATAPP